MVHSTDFVAGERNLSSVEWSDHRAETIRQSADTFEPHRRRSASTHINQIFDAVSSGIRGLAFATVVHVFIDPCI